MMKPKRGQIFRLKSDSSSKARPIVIVSRDEINGGHSVLAVPFIVVAVASDTNPKRKRGS